MTKHKRYILKKTKVQGRGGGPSLDAWYVYDTKFKVMIGGESVILEYAKKLCEDFNNMDEDND